MPYAPINVLLKSTIPPKGTLSIPYPEGKNEGHFFGGMNHTLSIEGNFFRSPRDFTLFTHPDHILFSWNGMFALPAGALLNIQADIPGGDFYYDAKIGVTVSNMVHSPIFMVNLASPAAADAQYWVELSAAGNQQPLKLLRTQAAIARNVIVHSATNNSHATFIIEGEDLYRRAMVEHITPSDLGFGEGKKAFMRVNSIRCTEACDGTISIGNGNKMGLPVFLPSPGYLIREIVDGVVISGGQVISGETDVPSAITGDRRGTYTPPESVVLNGQHSIHLLLSLLAPGNIGIPDFAG